LKRPGLSMFLSRLSRFYEVVIFGDEENGVIIIYIIIIYRL
jgi:TFIIF-interacting CTD phosphatase-like protein